MVIESSNSTRLSRLSRIRSNSKRLRPGMYGFADEDRIAETVDEKERYQRTGPEEWVWLKLIEIRECGVAVDQ